MRHPGRGEIWLADLNPVRGHEQAGMRPVLVVSHDVFNRGPADLVIVVPITSRIREIATHVHLNPPEGGLKTPSSCMCEAVRSVSRSRLRKRFGQAETKTMKEVEFALGALLDL